MTYIHDHDTEIARAACKVAWLETLHEGLCNGTQHWVLQKRTPRWSE